MNGAAQKKWRKGNMDLSVWKKVLFMDIEHPYVLAMK